MKPIHLLAIGCWTALAGGMLGAKPVLLADGASAKIAEERAIDTATSALSEFSWLEGKWQGNWGPRIAEQVWMAPKADEMTGLFRVAENDKTLVLELYSILETADGVEMRLRHFTPSLVPWEQSEIAILRLASLDKGAVFENTGSGQPSRQTLIRVDPDTYLLRTEITAGGDNKQVTEIRFRRAGAVLQTVAPGTKKKSSKN